jgi:bilirubin oxidase
VRLRILNIETERGYILGFSDNRSFKVIGNDGGLLNAPITNNRLKVFVGERYEILVDLSGDAVGSSIDLKAYNSGQALGFPGGEAGTTGNFGSLLNNKDFNILHINVGATTANPITIMPTSLINNTYLTAADASVNRTVAITGGTPPGGLFTLDNKSFDFNTINHTVIENTTEKWTVTNNNVFGHCFHIHDVQFKIISRSTGAVGDYESGWKDNFFINRNESVSFVARFQDYADATHPFMYHCHFSNHEDEGMMGQFVVKSSASGLNQISQKNVEYRIFPNPTASKISVQVSDPQLIVYYISIVNLKGKTVMMLPQPDLTKSIGVSMLAKGTYILDLMDKETKSISSQKFVIE